MQDLKWKKEVGKKSLKKTAAFTSQWMFYSIWLSRKALFTLSKPPPAATTNIQIKEKKLSQTSSFNTLTSQLSDPLKHNNRWLSQPVLAALFRLFLSQRLSSLQMWTFLLHKDKDRKGVPAHPARNTPKRQGRHKFSWTSKFGKLFVFLATFNWWRVTARFLFSFLQSDNVETTRCSRVKRRCSGLAAKVQTFIRNLLLFICKARKPHFLLFSSASPQTISKLWHSQGQRLQ